MLTYQSKYSLSAVFICSHVFENCTSLFHNKFHKHKKLWTLRTNVWNWTLVSSLAVSAAAWTIIVLLVAQHKRYLLMSKQTPPHLDVSVSSTSTICHNLITLYLTLGSYCSKNYSTTDIIIYSTLINKNI